MTTKICKAKQQDLVLRFREKCNIFCCKKIPFRFEIGETSMLSACLVTVNSAVAFFDITHKKCCHVSRANNPFPSYVYVSASGFSSRHFENSSQISIFPLGFLAAHLFNSQRSREKEQTLSMKITSQRKCNNVTYQTRQVRIQFLLSMFRKPIERHLLFERFFDK